MTTPSINVQQLRRWLAQDQSVTLLDIRPTADHAEWSIPNSLHVDAYDDLKAGRPNALDTMELPMDRPVVTICGAGKTSRLAADRLLERGFNALSLDGGMQAWSMAWNDAYVPMSNSKANVIQVRRTGKGCLSYLIGSEEEAAVIDPALDAEIYLNLAQAHGWTISHVIETHVHADHLSRGRELAAQSGAILYLPANSPVIYPYGALEEGDVIGVGQSEIKSLHTPGHTMESTSYLLDGEAVFTGDTLFTDSVGRPDLEASAGEAHGRAQHLYRSLRRLLTLSPQTVVLPGHTNKPLPFDQVALMSTLAQVQDQVPLLHLDEDEFVETILRRLPPTPPNHHRIVALNQSGTLPAGDTTELEAGANRCAIA